MPKTIERWNGFSVTNASFVEGKLASGKKYWSDGTPVAGQQFEYGFDDIGNRQSTKSGGDAVGSSLRLANYSANSLNQYTSRDVPGYMSVLGSANPNATVTVNLQRAVRQGSYFWNELSVDNSSTALWLSLTNLAVLNNGTNADIVATNIGNVFLPQTPETFGYDTDGNLTNDGRFTYTWDGENRLINLTSLASAPTGSKVKLDFAYDYQGRRIQKIVSLWNTNTLNYQPSTTNRFVYDGWNLIAILNPQSFGAPEQGGGGSIIESFTWGLDLSGSEQGAGGVGGLLSMTVNAGPNAGTYFYTYDGNGNVASLVRGADGSVAGQWEYDAFGNALRATGPLILSNPFLFSTKFFDFETGLYYYGYRYYNPNTGRWPNRDPLEEEGGINLYGLLSNDPNNDSDYLGQFSVNDIKGLITDSVTGSADAIFNFIQNHPAKAWEVSLLNRLLPPLKGRAASLFDSNTKTMGWRDVIFDWFFELGNTPFEFVDKDKTTEELKKHEGVNQARAQAKKDCAAGKHTTEKTWVYGVDQFYHSISSADSIAIALGSYSVTVKSSSDCGEFDFSVLNDSTWESATRFRKATTPGGQHQAILSNRVRGGPGIQLGGNMREHWTWKEICNKEK